MRFTHSETFGDKPISDWMARQLARYVSETYGLDVRVTVNTNCPERSDRHESCALPTSPDREKTTMRKGRDQ